jgi:hypothetical protein
MYLYQKMHYLRSTVGFTDLRNIRVNCDSRNTIKQHFVKSVPGCVTLVDNYFSEVNFCRLSKSLDASFAAKDNEETSLIHGWGRFIHTKKLLPRRN